MNLVDVELTGDQPMLGSMAVPLTAAMQQGIAERGAGTYTVGVRPEHLTVGTDGVAGKVVVVEELGSESFLHVHIDHQGETLTLQVRAEGETSIRRGDQVQIAVDGPVHLFSPEGERVGD